MDSMTYDTDQTQTCSTLSNFFTYLTFSLSSCGIPLPLPLPCSPSDSDSDEDEPSILYDRSPGPESEFESMSSRIPPCPSPEIRGISSRMGMGEEQTWFTTQSEVQGQVQMSAVRKREVREEDDEDEIESEDENEAERHQRIMSEFHSGMDTPIPSPIPSLTISQASSSNSFLTTPSPATPSPINNTSPSSPSSNNAWQTAELNELKRICADEGCGQEIAMEKISEGDYERIAKGMNGSFWWQMEIPVIRKPREYTGENVVGGVEALRGEN